MHEIGEMQQTRNRQIGASESEDYTNGQQTLRTERQEERRAKSEERRRARQVLARRRGCLVICSLGDYKVSQCT